MTAKVPSKRRIMAALSVAVSLGLIVWLLGRMDMARARELVGASSIPWLALAAALVLTMPPLASLRWLGVLKSQQGMNLPFPAALRAVMLANVLNSFLPSKAGDAAKAVFLRKTAGLSRGVGSVAVERLTDFFVLGILGIIGSLRSGALWGLVAGGMMAGGVACFYAAVLTVPFARLPLPEKIKNIAASVREVFTGWIARPACVAQTALASLAHWSAAGLIVVALTRAVGGAAMPASYAFGVFPLAVLAGLVPASVSGIGVRDAAFVQLLGVHLTLEQATLTGFGYTVFVYWMLALVSLPAVAWQVRAYLREGREAGVKISAPNLNAEARLHRDRRALPLFLLFAALVYTPFIDNGIGQGNVASDLAAIESLVERETFYINDSGYVTTIDKFKNGDHFFSQKSPVFHVIAAVPYAAMRAMGFSLRQNETLCLHVLTLFMSVFPMGWLLWALWSHPWMARRSGCQRSGWTAAFAFGSLLAPFALTLNHYVLASAALMQAWKLICMPEKKLDPSSNRSLLMGFFISLSFASDIPPAFIFGVGLAIWQAVKAPRQLIWLALGAAPLAALYAGLNIAILGSPLPPNMHESSMLYYEGSFWNEIRDRIERGEPDYYQASYWRRLYHGTLGHRGFYWMTPLLALATGRALRVASKRRRARTAMLAAVMFPLAALALTMRWAQDMGGGSYGVRHIFAAAAPLFAALAFPLAIRRKKLWRAAVAMATILGCAVAALGAFRPWSHNTYSAWPPLDNLAAWAMEKPHSRPTGWIPRVIAKTSVVPATGFLDLGQAWMNHRSWSQAGEAFSLAVDCDQNLIEGWYYLGICLDQAGRHKQAWEVYGRLIAQDPDNIGAINNRGMFAIRGRQYELARAAFEISMQKAPDNAGALAGLLWIEYEQGRARPDHPLLKRALSAHPNEPRIRQLAGRFAKAGEK